MSEELFHVRDINGTGHGRHSPNPELLLKLKDFCCLWKISSFLGINVERAKDAIRKHSNFSQYLFYILALIFLSYSTAKLILVLPCFFSLLIRVLYSNSSHLLDKYHERLKKVEDGTAHLKFITIYSVLIELIQDQYNLLIVPNMLCNAIYFLHLFTPAFAAFCEHVMGNSNLDIIEDMTSTSEKISFACTVMVCLIAFLCVPSCLHRMHTQMTEITDLFARIQEIAVFNFSADYRTVEILKIVSKKNHLTISTFDVVYSNPNIVVIGTMFVIANSIKQLMFDGIYDADIAFNETD
ncbi:hypothetical protein NPIL_375381 [Nephila pilipes]|uniref:Uncharacterized protein n=1 Tax=Nephila pilipes TaxID=299642 RepID=A0A8X6MVM0_NEPPI|nr:hypothetical protein NPIL_375381 [Nephila pilipes]